MSETPFSNPLKSSGAFVKKAASIFKQAHEDADTDADRSAIHHTLGAGPLQAAPGNHNHDKSYVKAAGQGQIWAANVRQQDGSACAHTPRYYRYSRMDNWVTYHLVVLIQQTSGINNVIFDLPVPLTNPPAHAIALGGGRENNATGKLLTVFNTGALSGVICSETSLTVINGWQLSVTGTYIVDSVP